MIVKLFFLLTFSFSKLLLLLIKVQIFWGWIILPCATDNKTHVNLLKCTENTINGSNASLTLFIFKEI